MSDDLADEVKAINAIYGTGTLTLLDAAVSPSRRPDADSDGEAGPAFKLALPGNASVLRLRFPAGYPASITPPHVLGTHSSVGGARAGLGARQLRLFRDAVACVFRPGEVCLHDALEDYERRATEHVGDATALDGAEADAPVERERQDEAPPAEATHWTLSAPICEAKSVFEARVARVTSPSQARACVSRLLAEERRLRGATHNISAWRVHGEGGIAYQDCDDDGEAAAGGRLLRLLQLMDLWDVVVVVSRWYGGVKLGPQRFALINAVARDAFVRAGFVADSKVGTQAKKSG